MNVDITRYTNVRFDPDSFPTLSIEFVIYDMTDALKLAAALMPGQTREQMRLAETLSETLSEFLNTLDLRIDDESI